MYSPLRISNVSLPDIKKGTTRRTPHLFLMKISRIVRVIRQLTLIPHGHFFIIQRLIHQGAVAPNQRVYDSTYIYAVCRCGSELHKVFYGQILTEKQARRWLK
ncbi:hypothetical protein ABU178_12800 [Pantoea osteomyelitidis]|uniref:Uncharacterized protein n=1 Tax=Pantoea osteomyelitidis TaxID=3230026 RepID=A0ABW7PXJ5_9GAMM